MTAGARIRFVGRVYAGERALAKARVTATVRHRTEVEVIMKTRERVVFEGTFTVYRMTKTVALQLRRRDGVPESGEKPCSG